MALEIEAKARVDDLDPVRERLKALGGRFVESGLEHNVLFDTADGRLRRADSLLRLRRYNGCTVTFKGPRESENENLKARREIEVEVSDCEAAALIFEAVGLVPSWIYEKRREKWLLGEAMVFLDEAARLGTFVEVEAPSKDAVAETLDLLGVGPETLTPKTYFELFEEFRRQSGAGTRDMVFQDGEE